ncbi:MAG TPA: AAA family ATPase [Bryobacteraceae bacterium]
MNREQFQPREIHKIEETGLSNGMLTDLVLKHVFFEGTALLRTIADRTKLHPAVILALYRQFQKEQLVETHGMQGEDYEISLSNKGRSMAEVALKKGQYAGPAPVTLPAYNQAVAKQGIPLKPSLETLRAAMSDLILPDHVIYELGTALVTGGTIMLYGETGLGKTSIAERLHRVFEDNVYIPYAVEAGGHIITVYDPLMHTTVEDESDRLDSRWVLCQRPMVKVGGEMRTEMLDPHIDDVTRICTAPLQMKANNGILLIDDFGRQRVSPRELLNRWIVPLDRRKDIMSMWSGVSFEIPFELVVVFATNLTLSDLAEEAFLRRLKNKIKMEAMPPELFDELVRRVCRQKNLWLEPGAEQYLRTACAEHSTTGLRACYPEDIASAICGMAAFAQRTAKMDPTSIDAAMKVYFVH